ncbi:MAG TPA: [protein-PII] uridylyltransferase [Kofleriaceae bacterium]|nr:[protein-PII] uridylyltransferase [Kofleriaceae bacterium]
MVAPAPNAVAAELKASIQAARQRMARLGMGASGIEVCRELSDEYDGIVRGLWDAVAEGVPGADRMALVATGGWGRRELCPFSDIDFILLCGKRELGQAKQLADKLLYPLWDAGIEVGHAVRDPASAARLAKDDLATATSLLDLRRVAGSQDPVLELEHATRRAIAPGGNANDFVARLVAEQRSRHDRFGDSLYLLEPNLKQGIGALRDLATAVWAARARWSITELRELVSMGYATPRQVAVLEAARDVLLEIRTLVQLTSGRPTDQLTFEIQEAIAPKLYPDTRRPEGDVRPAVAPVVEALMRHYYLHARGVVQVAERLLESATVPARRRPRIRKIDRTFLTFNGKLSLHDPSSIASEPAEMLRLFRVALELDLPIYGHTKELIANTTVDRGSAITGNPVAGQYFLEALCDPRDAKQPSLLEEMHQLGLLNAVMPEFAPCTCRVQHDLYHVYTVDQHQLYAVAMLKRLARGELTDELPTATAAMAAVQRPVPLYLATLLHDAGKPLGKGHAEKGARLAHTIGTRLGLPAEDVSTCEFLVRQHLTMSHLSQRRDLSDPEVIARFAEKVETEERLVQLYLLTLVDTAMTSPTNLTAWKEQLMRELYLRTREFLRGGDRAAIQHPEELAELKRRAIELLARSGLEDVAARRFLDSIDERFFMQLSPRQVARHVEVAREREQSKGPVALSVAHYPLKGHSELALAAADVPGLLSAIAGTLSANRVDILEAVVGCRAGDSADPAAVALDLFYVRDLVGQAIPADDARWDRIRADLCALLAGGSIDSEQTAQLIARRRKPSAFGERVTPAVATDVRIDNDASSEYTVVEVFTRDRVGVLYVITRTLAELGLDIHLAKISTEGEKAADVFYVSDANAGDDGPIKITDRRRVEAIRAKLTGALADSEG